MTNCQALMSNGIALTACQYTAKCFSPLQIMYIK